RNDGVMACGYGAHVFVVDCHFAADASKDRGIADIGSGEQQERGAGGGEPGYRVIEDVGNLVGVAARAQYVVAAGAEGDQIRLQLNARIKLLGNDLPDEPPTNREIGICEVRNRAAQFMCQAIGPAKMPANVCGIRVPDAFGEGVSDGDIAAPWMDWGF